MLNGALGPVWDKDAEEAEAEEKAGMLRDDRSASMSSAVLSGKAVIEVVSPRLLLTSEESGAEDEAAAAAVLVDEEGGGADGTGAALGDDDDGGN